MLSAMEFAVAKALQSGRTLDQIIDDVNREMKDKIRKFAEYSGASSLSQYVAARQDTRAFAQKLKANPALFTSFMAKCLSEKINIVSPPAPGRLPPS